MKKLPLNLIYLKYFCDAVRHGSISASARENFVTQSAISQGIANLERSLGKDLITHQANRFKPTPEGMLVFEKGRPVFSSIEELEDALNQEEGTIGGRIEFACMHSFALALLPKFILKSQKQWPKLHVNFRLAHTDVIKDQIKKGMIDFGIVLDNEDLSSFDCHELYRGKYGLYISKKKTDAKKLPFILSEERVETNILKTSYRKKRKKEMDVLMEVSSWEVIANLTEEGLGIGYFPDYVALKHRKLLTEIPNPYQTVQYKIFAIFPKATKVPKNCHAFLDLLKDHIESHSI